MPTSLKLSEGVYKLLTHISSLTGESRSGVLERLIQEAKPKELRELIPKENKHPVSYWIDDRTDRKLKKMAERLDCTQASILEVLIQNAIDVANTEDRQ